MGPGLQRLLCLWLGSLCILATASTDNLGILFLSLQLLPGFRRLFSLPLFGFNPGPQPRLPVAIPVQRQARCRGGACTACVLCPHPHSWQHSGLELQPGPGWEGGLGQHVWHRVSWTLGWKLMSTSVVGHLHELRHPASPVPAWPCPVRVQWPGSRDLPGCSVMALALRGRSPGPAATRPHSGSCAG